jgi:hypothetical protein
VLVPSKYASATSRPAPSPASDANRKSCAYPQAEHRPRVGLQEIGVRPVEVRPPAREEQDEAAEREQQNLAGDTVLGDRTLHRADRTEDRLAEDDQGEQAVPLGDVLAMVTAVKSCRSIVAGTTAAITRTPAIWTNVSSR